MLALGGVAALVCVFALTWERWRVVNFTLWDIRREVARSHEIGFFTAGEALSYQVPAYTALASGVIALLAGGLAAALGTRAVNLLATLGGLIASFLAIFTPVYYFFRVWDIDDLDVVITDVVGAGFFVLLAVSLFLLVATIVVFVGVFRAGRATRPVPPGRPGHPRPPGIPQQPGSGQLPGSGRPQEPSPYQQS